MRPWRRILEVVSQPELRAKVQHYWDQLEQHSSTMGKAPTCAVRSIYRGSGASDQAQFELWVINIDSRAVPFFLWERWSCDSITEAEYHEALSAIREVTAKVHVAFEPRRSWYMGHHVAEPPLWRYHPCRFAAMMPFAKAVERAATVGPAGVMTSSGLDALRGIYFKADGQTIGADADSSRVRPRIFGTRSKGRRWQRFINVMHGYAMYSSAGKQIFDVPPALAAMFRKTDVDDIPAGSIKMPYRSMYLHFGRQEDLKADDGWVLDGAYVSDGQDAVGSRVITITVTAALESPAFYADFSANLEPC